LTVALLPALTACPRTSPIHNVSNAVVTSKPVKLEEVRTAIVRGGQSRGWEMTPGAPGHIVGTLYLRGNLAQVDIQYTTTTYSITKKNVEGLDYEAPNTHTNYNGCIGTPNKPTAQQLSPL